MDEPGTYKVVLCQAEVTQEFEWPEMHVCGYLGTRLGSEAAASDALAELEEKGTVTRTIQYALGDTARIIVSRF